MEEGGIVGRMMKIGKNKIKVWIVYNRDDMKEMKGKMGSIIKEKEEEIMILGGNFNARIGTMGEVYMGEKTENTNRRKLKDKVVKTKGKCTLKMTEERGFHIANGNVRGDEEGGYAYIGPRYTTVIDYGIINVTASERTCSFRVGERTESDHQPISLTLGIQT